MMFKILDVILYFEMRLSLRYSLCAIDCVDLLMFISLILFNFHVESRTQILFGDKKIKLEWHG